MGILEVGDGSRLVREKYPFKILSASNCTVIGTFSPYPMHLVELFCFFSLIAFDILLGL